MAVVVEEASCGGLHGGQAGGVAELGGEGVG